MEEEIIRRALKYEEGMIRTYKKYLQQGNLGVETARIIKQLLANKEKDLHSIKYLASLAVKKSSCGG